MGQRLSFFAVCVLWVMASARPAPAQEIRSASGKAALEAFRRQAGDASGDLLARLRPAPLDATARAQVLATLPARGDLRPSMREREAIEAVERMLDYSARKGMITVKVVDLDFAFIGLYFRTVVLVSRPQLAILDTDEIVALAAHEVGHDYDWEVYVAAMHAKDDARRRELELRADGMAVLTLRGMGLDPERLVSALKKTMHYNEHRGSAVNPEDYVPLTERVAFIRAIGALRWGDTPLQTAGTSGASAPPR